MFDNETNLFHGLIKIPSVAAFNLPKSVKTNYLENILNEATTLRCIPGNGLNSKSPHCLQAEYVQSKPMTCTGGVAFPAQGTLYVLKELFLHYFN